MQLATTKPWWHLHRCPRGISPSPAVGKPRGGFWVGGKGQGPHRVAHPGPGLLQLRELPAQQCPRAQGEPGPATSLPGTKWGIEGHSRALSILCLPGRGRLPSAGSLGPVLPPQLQGARGTHGNCGRDMGHPRDQAAPATALRPWGPTSVPTRMPLPHGGHGAGESSCKVPVKRGKTSSLEPPKLKAGPWDWEPLFL